MTAAFFCLRALVNGGFQLGAATLLVTCLMPGALAGPRVPEIALNDQFDRLHRHREPFSRPLVVVIADRRGASQIEGWVSELYDRHGQSVDIVGVADLQGVPDFMKNALRKAFRKQCTTHPILLDWNGDTTEAFDRGGSGLDVYAVDPGGDIVASASGAVSRAKLTRLSEALEKPAGAFPVTR